jgi:hypothetical protein
MKKIYFEQDELTLMAIYSALTKQETIRALKEALEDLEQEEADEADLDMPDILSSLIEKLQLIEDKYYYSIDLQEYLNDIEEETYAK